MYKTIIIPVDVGHKEQNSQLLEKVNKLMGDSEIILLHVVEELPEFMLKLASGVSFDSGAGTIDEGSFDNSDNASKELEELVEKTAVKARIEVRKGKAYDCIIDSATENKADLIVINSHQSDIQHYLLGSTAERVVRHAPCAVLVER